jgi:murein DD-endopeptidase MepM/ murein hydrolase activator NlpD
MRQQKHFYTFVFAPSASSPFRKIVLKYNVIYAILALAFMGLVGVGAVLTRQAVLKSRFDRVQMENRKLRDENLEAKNNLDRLQGRLSMIEMTSRKLAEATGVTPSGEVSANVGSGGPSGTDMEHLEKATATLERQLGQIKEIIDRNQLKLSATPAGWPVRGYVTGGFGMRTDPFGDEPEVHSGLDIATTFGASVETTADGIVIFAGTFEGYGNVVAIDHGYGITTRYGHLSRIDVTVGQRLQRGMQIGAVGSTGRSTGPHCHYEVRLNERPVNPYKYLSPSRS